MGIAVSAVIVSLGASLAYVGLRANKTSSERDVALGLAEEAFESVRSAAFENWATVYAFSKGSGNLYYPVKDADVGNSYKWISHPISGTTWSTTQMNAVSALSPKNVWVTGDSSNVWNWDGANWKQF
ncbi:MAG: hypothetical protein A3B23_03035 [Candidatus Colwellbacteria bacterium RIFCSPLOWO2_01_FULL_48_10]|nr:MAG: hypothetical protein A3B23_03035 [Candidatus Colwellbacteria bacterium RIFCSPLOWO2_01_FULL_48_10]